MRFVILTAVAVTLGVPSAREAQTPATPAPVSPTPRARAGIDVLDYTFRVSFPVRPPISTIDVASVVTFRRAAGTRTLVLDLVKEMQVQEARVNGAAASFVHEGDTVRIELPAAGDSLSAELRYRGRPKDGLIIADSAGRWTAFADHYPDRARQWLATVDHPSDKATVTWEVRTPVGVRVIANGELLEESYEASPGAPEMRLTRWRSSRPLYTAVMVIGVAPFAVVELGRTACGLGEFPGCVSQSVWVMPEVREKMPGSFARAGEMVALFSRLVGPFPYEKLAHVQSATRYGGMENAAAIFYADGLFRRNGVGEGLIAHESAHQWFGDAVTERDWPDVWLSEGFATYFAALWTEHSRGDSAFRSDMRRMREQVLRAPVTVAEPVVRREVPDLSRLLNSNVYQKAGFVLHMLRREVGDSAFFRGIRSYYAKYRHGNATTADFRAEIEKASRANLGWFFDQWMYRPGFAELTTAWRYEAARRRVHVTVEQGERFPPYRVPLDVRITTRSGKVFRSRVTVPASRVATVQVPVTLDGEPRSVEFDADVSVLGTVQEKR